MFQFSPKKQLDSAKAPSRSQRFGGWADENHKSGSASSGDRLLSAPIARKLEDEDAVEAPDIPELDRVQEDELTAQVARAPNVTFNRVATYKELDKDLVARGVFSFLEEVDLSLLTRSVAPEANLKEADIPWTFDTLFAEIASESKTTSNTRSKNLPLPRN